MHRSQSKAKKREISRQAKRARFCPVSNPSGLLASRTLQLVTSTDAKAESDPDCDRSTVEIVTGKGYPCEEHTVETPDGWILGLHVRHLNYFNGVGRICHGSSK